MDNISEQELIELLGSEKNFKTALSTGYVLYTNFDKIKEKGQEKIIEQWKTEIRAFYPNITIKDNPKEYDDRAIFVVEIEKIHAYIGWSRDKFPGSLLFCQVEYDSEYRCKKNEQTRPLRDEAFEELYLQEILGNEKNNKNEWCRYKCFGKEYEDYARVFDCLKKVIEKIIKAMPK